MMCDDALTDWLPYSLCRDLEIKGSVHQGLFVMNLDNVMENIRWYAKPNEELLLAKNDDKTLYWSRKYKQFRIYNSDDNKLESVSYYYPKVGYGSTYGNNSTYGKINTDLSYYTRQRPTKALINYYDDDDSIA